jgi:integrase
MTVSHAAASPLIAARLPPVQVAKILGHVDRNITLKVYAHLWEKGQSDEDIRQAFSGVGSA